MTIVSERIEDAVRNRAPEPVIWCEEINGVLTKLLGAESSFENRSLWAVPCEEVDGVLYPYGEGGERVVHGLPHFTTLTRAVNMVQCLLRDRPRSKLVSDILTYWVKGNHRKSCAPDLHVLPEAVEKTIPQNWVRLWEEHSWPIFIMEILSNETEEKDTDKNFQIYQNELKTPDYFICEPRTDPMDLWGYRLVGGIYQPIEPDRQGRLWSEQLECWLGINDRGKLQLWEPSGEPLPDYKDALQQRDQAVESARRDRQRAEQDRQRTEQETRLRGAAEARIHDLEEELRRIRG